MLEGSAHLLRLTASRHSEIRADRAAAEAYGAQIVIDALRKIDRAAAWRPADLRTGAGKAYAFAMISDGPADLERSSFSLCDAIGVGAILRTHPTLEQRVKALEAAAPQNQRATPTRSNSPYRQPRNRPPQTKRAKLAAASRTRRTAGVASGIPVIPSVPSGPHLPCPVMCWSMSESERPLVR